MKKCVCGQVPKCIDYPFQITCFCGLSTQANVYDTWTEERVKMETKLQWDRIVDNISNIR